MKSSEEFFASVMNRVSEEKKARTVRKRAAVIVSALCCAAALAIVFPLLQKQNGAPAVSYRVMLDINPSMELSVDDTDTVVDIHAYNEDGSKIASDLETGKSLEETVEKAIDCSVDQGYLSEESNSVLISVVSDDGANTEEKQEKLTAEVIDQLKKKDIEGAVLSQTVTKEEEADLKQTSDAYLMSPGRVMLINQILAQNSLKTFEELSALTVNDLNLLRVSYQIDSAKTSSTGTSASMKYLGEDAATKKALTNENFTLADVTDCTCELDCVHSVMLYEICFTKDGFEYRYRINAVTGEILLADKREEGAAIVAPQGDKPAALVGENPILAAALAHAEMDDKALLSATCKSDWVDGMAVYIVSFSDSTYNCKYTYCATNGELVQYYKAEQPVGHPLDVTLVGVSAAKAAALSANGLLDGSVTKFVCRLERNWIDNVYTYRMDIICAEKRYEVSVNALTGEILENLNQQLAKDQGVLSEHPDQNQPSPEQ